MAKKDERNMSGNGREKLGTDKEGKVPRKKEDPKEMIRDTNKERKKGRKQGRKQEINK
jgi:hypothetical protein